MAVAPPTRMPIDRRTTSPGTARLRAALFLARRIPAFVANRLRMVLLRLGGLRIGPGTMMWTAPTIWGEPTNLSIGPGCGFNVGCVFDVAAPITIGRNVAVGHDVAILTRSHEVGDHERRAGATFVAPVVIEDGVWIAARCTIMPGVTIGAGSVIGATMVITQDVPANTLLSGSQKVSLARWR